MLSYPEEKLYEDSSKEFVELLHKMSSHDFRLLGLALYHKNEIDKCFEELKRVPGVKETA